MLILKIHYFFNLEFCMNFIKSEIVLKRKSAWEEPGRALLQKLIAVYSLHNGPRLLSNSVANRLDLISSLHGICRLFNRNKKFTPQQFFFTTRL